MSLAGVRQRRQSVETMHDIVNAMRAIAAGRIHGAQAALESARRYNEIVLQAGGDMLSVLATAPPPARRLPTGLLIMTSEQPLCGALNQNVLALAERRWRELRNEGAIYVVVVGQRGLRELATRAMLPDHAEPAATALSSLRDLVKRVAGSLGARYAAQQLGALRVIYPHYQSVSEQVPTEEQVLPPDHGLRQTATARRRTPLSSYLSRTELEAGILQEYAFISLYRISAEAYTSEQASRLVAMDGATRNTERMLEDLRALEGRERQAEVTRQVLELIGARFALPDAAALRVAKNREGQA
jgi:F-type H+-transporting ATPase subunit gamma